jgi:hypothetical protein
MEHMRKTALKHSKISVATPTKGPNRRTSSYKCASRWSLILSTIRFGSIMTKRSRTFPAAISRSRCDKIVSIWFKWEAQKTDQIDVHIMNLRKP